MKTFGVTLPITGYLYLEVQAANEAEALQRAMDDHCRDDIEEWEACEVVVEGNIFYGRKNHAEVELLDEGDGGVDGDEP